jgi:hypothetical protein
VSIALLSHHNTVGGPQAQAGFAVQVHR